MAQVYIPGWLYGVLRMSSQGNTFENTFSMKTTAGLHPSGSTLAALALDWWATVGPFLKAATSTSLVFQSVTIRDLNDNTGEEGVYTIPVNTTGDINSDPVPYNAASVISWRSATVGRRGRGRWYMTGIPESHVSGNVIDATLQTLITAVATAISAYAGTVAVPTDAVVASRVATILHPIVEHVVDTLVDSQRRRLQQRGI
jgi:hypothetical protein